MKKTEEKVIRFIEDNALISPGDKILIALSGGPDSVFLTHFLNKFKKKYKITLGALHINHMLRGKAASEDEKFCKEFCGELDIAYYSSRKNAAMFARKNKISFEEAGRIIRYNALEKTARKEKYSRIATAHNSNDNAETVLLNLIKGTGLKGLSGIPVTRGKIIRPILPLPRDEILKYLDKNNIGYRTDESNSSTIYERNFLRSEVIPLIKKRLNPSFEDALLHSSHIFRQHYQEVKKHVERLLKNHTSFTESGLHINDKVLDEGEALVTELIKTALERNFSIQPSFKDILNISQLIGNIRGSRINLLPGLTASKEKDGVVVFSHINDAFVPLELGINQKVQINNSSFYITEAAKSSFTSRKPGEEYIAADDLDERFFIREWQIGDKFFPLGMRGSKKVSDYLNEKKIDTHLKHKTLLLTNRKRIVWVIGMRLDNRFRITDHTKRILRLWLK